MNSIEKLERLINKENEAKVFLQMSLCKSLQKDENGNVIFEVEASNENLDADGQRVLQSALMKTKDYFLRNGVISKDHKHRTFNKNGGFDIHEEYIIGEPIDVYTKGNQTFVKGKLYPNNEYAQKFVNLLERGSSLVKASVGGLIPKVKNLIESGKNVGEVISVLWDDLALTITPVNSTVGYATSVMSKSLSSRDFVYTLSAKAMNKNNYGGISMKTLRYTPEKHAAIAAGRILETRRKLFVTTLEKARPILVEAVSSGELNINQASKIETRINQ